MKRKIGTALILFGLVLIGAALGLLLHNQREEARAAQAVEEVAPRIVEAIGGRQAQQAQIPKESLPAFFREQEPDPDREMPAVTIDGQDYIGYLSIPALELELPVMGQWSYPRLRMAPCRYTGSLYKDDLVVMAHNYSKHFGRLDQLRPGDRIEFTDMDGLTVAFQVTVLDVLAPEAIQKMTAGEYDLTLFTCTYGGKSRVTVRCDKTE